MQTRMAWRWRLPNGREMQGTKCWTSRAGRAESLRRQVLWFPECISWLPKLSNVLCLPRTQMQSAQEVRNLKFFLGSALPLNSNHIQL